MLLVYSNVLVCSCSETDQHVLDVMELGIFKQYSRGGKVFLDGGTIRSGVEVHGCENMQWVGTRGIKPSKKDTYICAQLHAPGIFYSPEKPIISWAAHRLGEREESLHRPTRAGESGGPPFLHRLGARLHQISGSLKPLYWSHYT